MGPQWCTPDLCLARRAARQDRAGPGSAEVSTAGRCNGRRVVRCPSPLSAGGQRPSARSPLKGPPAGFQTQASWRGWDRLVLRASQIEPERSRQSYPLSRTDGRFSRADCLLGCARCGGCICPSVRAAAAVGMSAAAVDSEQGSSNSGSESAVVWISFVCICKVARAPSICRLASASRRARNPRATASISLALQSLGFSVSQRPSASKQSAALTAVRWLRATTRHWNPRRGAG